MNDPSPLSKGCLDIWIDEIVPCLRDTETGEMKDTVVFRIESRSYLKKFQETMAGILTGITFQEMWKYMRSLC